MVVQWESEHDIWKKMAYLFRIQREAIGLRVRNKETRRLKMPGYDVLNDLPAAVVPSAYARALTAWLQTNQNENCRGIAGEYCHDGGRGCRFSGFWK